MKIVPNYSAFRKRNRFGASRRRPLKRSQFLSRCPDPLRRSTFGKLYYRTKIRFGRLVALGVVEKYRRAGIAEMLVLQVMDESVKRGITGEISMTLEDNFMINRFIEALGASRYKTYRIYRKQLPC